MHEKIYNMCRLTAHIIEIIMLVVLSTGTPCSPDRV